MKISKQTLLLTLITAGLLLSACGGSDGGNSDAVLTEAAQIAFQALTETAGAASPTPSATLIPPTATSTPALPTATPTPEGTLPTTTPVPTQGQSSGGGTSNAPCLRASFEIETIPDGTQFPAGTTFTKSWRLKNTGSCTWTASFSAIWIQGDLMDADSVVPFTTKDIPPGSYALIEVNMKAPNNAGHYKGYWMLRSNDGITFGVGTNGKEWFWVDIQSMAVVDEDE